MDSRHDDGDRHDQDDGEKGQHHFGAQHPGEEILEAIRIVAVARDVPGG